MEKFGNILAWAAANKEIVIALLMLAAVIVDKVYKFVVDRTDEGRVNNTWDIVKELVDQAIDSAIRAAQEDKLNSGFKTQLVTSLLQKLTDRYYAYEGKKIDPGTVSAVEAELYKVIERVNNGDI